MKAIVLTKWIDKVTPIGTAKHPACEVLGVSEWTDITGQLGATIAAGKYLLLLVTATQAGLDRIEANGKGVVLWQKGDAPLDAAAVTSINAKLTAYGVPAGATAKIKAGTALDTIESQVRTILQGQ